MNTFEESYDQIRLSETITTRKLVNPTSLTPLSVHKSTRAGVEYARGGYGLDSAVASKKKKANQWRKELLELIKSHGNLYETQIMAILFGMPRRHKGILYTSENGDHIAIRVGQILDIGPRNWTVAD